MHVRGPHQAASIHVVMSRRSHHLSTISILVSRSGRPVLASLDGHHGNTDCGGMTGSRTITYDFTKSHLSSDRRGALCICDLSSNGAWELAISGKYILMLMTAHRFRIPSMIWTPWPPLRVPRHLPAYVAGRTGWPRRRCRLNVLEVLGCGLRPRTGKPEKPDAAREINASF